MLFSVLLLHALLLFPGHPENLVPGSWARFPIELPVLLLLLLAVKGRLSRWLSLLLVLTLGLLLLLRMADLGSYLAFNRSFSPLLELHLISDGWNLASTSIGPVEASIVVLAGLLILLALAALLYRCLRTIAQLSGRTRTVTMALCTTCIAAGLVGLVVTDQTGHKLLIDAKVIPEFTSRITSLQQSIVDQRAFIKELQRDVVMDSAAPSFQALQNRDVILMFIESYGRGYIDAERFAAQSASRLSATGSTIEAAGLHIKSGWLTSPIRGGRSWLAHATLQSGLHVDNQARFDRLITTKRLSVSRLFSQAGWNSLGIMPAIQFAWPEATWYGFDELYTSADLGYAGQRFGYVTMPDQYTLSHFQKLREASDRPVMATMALLTTHAPWTPLPEKLDWDLIGDGSIYDGSHRFGEPISWKFRDKVQDMYARSFDYTLEVLGEYAARYADDALIIVVGDHQPPPIINGWGKSGDVPIHVISQDKDLLERLPSAHWTDGMLPAGDLLSQPMSEFRQTLSTVFECSACPL